MVDSFFGEFELFDEENNKRMWTARAKGKCIVYAIAKDSFLTKVMRETSFKKEFVVAMEERIRSFKRAERACGREIRRKLRVDIRIAKEKEEEKELVERNVEIFKQQYGDEWHEKMQKLEDIKRRRLEEDLFLEKQQTAIVGIRTLAKSPNLLDPANGRAPRSQHLKTKPSKQNFGRRKAFALRKVSVNSRTSSGKNKDEETS